MTDMGHYSIPRFVTALITAALLVYLANIAVIAAFRPTGETTGGINIDGITYSLSEDLKSSRVLRSDVRGYVDVASPDPVAHLDKDTYLSMSGQERSDLRNHENFHIIQKNLVAEAAGGFPSVWNPRQTARFYAVMHELDQYLARIMPSPRKDLPFRQGLETSADCWAQWRGSEDRDEKFSDNHNSYIPGACSNKSYEVVRVMGEEGRLPDDLQL